MESQKTVLRFFGLVILICLAGMLTIAGAQASDGQDRVADRAGEMTVQGQPAGADPTTFVVYLAEQADLSPAYDIRDWEARGRFVLDALRDVAARTQPAVLEALGGLQVQGHITEVHPHYIANLIVVRGDAEALRAARGMPGVAAVYPESWFQTRLPVQPVKVASGPETPWWNITRIGAPDVWASYGITGEGIVVANIDSGVEYLHPSMVNQYRGNLGGGQYDHDYNWWDPSDQYDYPWPMASPYPLSIGHGTLTMSVVVGDDGGVYQIGVAPGARWIAAFGFCSWECFLSAMEWMVAPWQVNDFDPDHPTADPAMRPHIVSNSWGAQAGLLRFEPLLDAWRAAGIFSAFAAGNNGETCGSMISPGDHPFTLGVGATNYQDSIASFSSRGPTSLEPWLDLFGTGPDLAAPGDSVGCAVPGGGYSLCWGTSLATPHVAGTAALLWSAEPGLVGRVEETEAILLGTALPLTGTQQCGGVPGSQVPNNIYGWGRLDALATVEMVWQAGTLAGDVAEAGSGTPVAGAQVTMERNGHAVLTETGENGDYSFPLGQGTYTVTVQAYGYETWSATDVGVTQDVITTLDVALTALDTHTLSGLVLEGGAQAPGQPGAARLGVRGTPVDVTTDPETGAYSASVAEGVYELRAVARGYVAESRPITVTGDLIEDFSLDPRLTYYYRDSRSPCGPSFEWIDATDGTPHSLDFMSYELITEPSLPPFSFYTQFHAGYYVSSNGLISFGEGHPWWEQDVPNLVIPFEGPPNEAIYGFAEMLDPALGAQGTIYSKVVDGRYLVIEYHEVEHWPSGQPETFEFIFDTARGVIKLQYLEVSWPDMTTVGVENAGGTDGVPYSYHNSAGITNSLAVEFYPIVGPPPADQNEAGVRGTISGTVVISGTSIPVPGAAVTATSFLQTLETTTGPGGRYAFEDVCADAYKVHAGSPGYYSGPAGRARLRWEGDVAVIELTLDPMPAAPSLDKMVTPAQVEWGALLTYTLSVGNEGPGPLYAAVLSDTLPMEVSYLSSEPPGSFEDGTVTWAIDLLAGGDAAEATILAYLIPPPGAAGPLPGFIPTITNTAYLLWAGTPLEASASFEAVMRFEHRVYLPLVLRSGP